MKLKKLFPYAVLFIISIVFFYKIFFLFLVPFPGDILVADYAPWKFEKYLGYNPGSYPNKAQYFDVARQMYPWKIFAMESVGKGQFPLWNPYNFSGMPFFANSQSAILNPMNLLFFVLSPTLAWSLFIYLQPLLCSAFSFLYLRKLKLSPIAALFGAIAFSYSLFMGVFVEYGNFGYSFLFLPLILYLVEELYTGKRRLGIIIPILIALTVFSGHLQIAGGTVIFVIIYTFARHFLFGRENKANLFFTLLFIVLGIGLSMVQILPIFDLLGNSARTMHSAEFFNSYILIQLHQLILFFSPDTYGNPATFNYLLKDTYPGNALYVGILPLFFAAFSLFEFKKNIYIKFFSIILLVIVLFLTGNPISNFIYSFNIPLLSASSPSNFMYLSSFCLVVLASAGLDEWFQKFDKKIFVSITVCILLFGLLFMTNRFLGYTLNTRQITLSFGIVIVSALSVVMLTFLKKKFLVYLFLIILVGDLWYYFIKFNPFVPPEFVFAKTPITTFLKKQGDARFWGYSAGTIESNFQTYYGISSPEGYDPLYAKWYGEFLYSSKNGRLLTVFDESTRSQALIQNGYAETNFSANRSRKKILDESGVGLVINRVESATSQSTFPKEQFESIYDNSGWTVYKNLNAKKRVYMTTQYDLYSSRQEFEHKFFSNNSLMLEKKPHIPISEKNDSGKASVVSETPNEVRIITDSSDNSILVLLDTYYPGWVATVDGKRVDILRANYTFRAIPLLSGRHTVIFSYRPPSFYLGLIITIISGIGSVGVYLYYRKIK